MPLELRSWQLFMQLPIEQSGCRKNYGSGWWSWWGGCVLTLQGGVITGTFFSTLMSDLGVDLAAPSYNHFSFYLTWPPKLVSQHLGILSLTNPLQLLVALAEVGPLIIVLPLVVIWGIS